MKPQIYTYDDAQSQSTAATEHALRQYRTHERLITAPGQSPDTLYRHQVGLQCDEAVRVH